MVSDSDLITRLHEFLSASDLNTTTTAIVRRRLEDDFGLDLSDRKAFIREQVDLYVQSQVENAVENEENSKEDSDGGDGDAAEEEEEVEEEEEEEEEESTTGKTASKKGSKMKKKEVKRRGGGGGFTKLCSLSPHLQKFTGVQELARTEVVKQLWSYIRENNLQDPSNRRNILCDDKLHDLFGVDTINMFQMNKALAKHIWPLESNGVSSSPKVKQRKQEREEDLDEPKRNEKRQKGGKSAFLAPLQLSDALAKFLGTGENSLPRCDVVKRIWDYIKQNNLQDPSDKRQIICDEKLKELFDVDTFHGFSVSKLLSVHFIKGEQSCS
ncbi:upstream activation factor subunit spp27-like [Olea europaea subsp. europaea]|uniref:Upstream activation factor subunit spp27-like n=3 Tax=Olea europaea subsp. europaea TaxID=158383 RepID=A0A8S0SXP7_OLEEU|nr:upstream activation factor subunit spp27-like [Olea europaea subsp. europaea]